jgi:iron complex outermembrane receptor protein
LKLEFDLGFQRNFRQELSQYVQHGYMPAGFPDSLSFNSDLERQFEKQVYSGNVKSHYQLSNRTQLILGLNSEFQVNQIDGRGFIIPAYKHFYLGSFVFAKHNFSDKSLIQGGIRYDYGSYGTTEYYDWFPSSIVENANRTMLYLQRAANLNRNFSGIPFLLVIRITLANGSIKQT